MNREVYAYSGSRYPRVPALGHFANESLDKPKSASFAVKFSPSKIFVGFTYL